MMIHQALRRSLSCVLALLVGLASASALWAAEVVTLNQVPADAPVVVVIPNLTKLSQKIAMLNDAMGLNLPPLADAMGSLKQQMNINRGFRDDGAMILVFTDAAAMMAGGEPPLVMLLPVTDYSEFVANFGGNGADAVTGVTMPEGKPGFAKKIEGYAVMGPTREVVEAYKPGNNAGAIQAAAGKLGGRSLEGGDAFVYVNMAVLSPLLQPKLQEVWTAAQRQFDAQGNSPNPAMARIVMKIYFDAAAAILRDSNTAVISLDMNELGVGLTYAGQFKPGSYVAGLFANGGQPSPLLAKLPNQPYLFAMTANMQGFPLATLVEEALARIPKEQGGGLWDVIRQTLPMLKLTRNVAGVYYVPPQGAGMGSSLLNGVNVLETTDAAAYMKGYKELIDAMNNIKIEMPPQPGNPPANPNPADPPEPAAITFKAQFTPNALQVDGVSVDQYQVQYNMPPELMRQMGQMGPMMMMLGGTGQSGYVAVSGNHVFSTTTLNVNLVRDTLASIKQEKGIGSLQTLEQVRQNLTPKPSMEAYISLTGIFATANNFMAMMGQPMIQAPADLPPVGLSLSTQEGGMAGRWFVPVPVVKAIMDAYHAFEARGPGPGPGGRGAPPPPRQGPAPAPF